MDFILGFSSVLFVYSNQEFVTNEIDIQIDDLAAIRDDWQQVGNDINLSLQQFHEQK